MAAVQEVVRAARGLRDLFRLGAARPPGEWGTWWRGGAPTGGLGGTTTPSMPWGCSVVVVGLQLPACIGVTNMAAWMWGQVPACTGVINMAAWMWGLQVPACTGVTKMAARVGRDYNSQHALGQPGEAKMAAPEDYMSQHALGCSLSLCLQYGGTRWRRPCCPAPHREQGWRLGNPSMPRVQGGGHVSPRAPTGGSHVGGGRGG